MKSDYNSKLSREIESMRTSIVDINSQYTQQQLEVYGYNPNKHWTILHQYEDAAGKVPTGITEMLKNGNLLKEERRLANELKPYNSFVFSYQESGSLPTENIGKEPVVQVQSDSLLTDCYKLIKELPRVIKENPKNSATVAGTAFAVPFILNAGPLADCVSDGKYEMNKYFDNIKLPELVGVASASTGISYPGDESNPYDDTQYLHSLGGVKNFFKNHDSFSRIDKSLNEPIILPDEITKIMESNTIPHKENPKYQMFGELKISPTDFAAWMAVASEETVAVCPYVALIDTDGNEKPDTLYAMYLGQRDDGKLTSTAGIPRGGFYDVDGNKIKFEEGYPDYLINPFDTIGSDNSNIANLLYFKDPSMVNFGDKPTAIHWKDALEYKTLGEIFGKSSNTPISEAKVSETEIYKEPVGEESAEKMVEDMRTDTATEKEKTNPLVYAGLAGLGAAGIYFATKKKSGKTPTTVSPV